MRFYAITITNPATGKLIQPGYFKSINAPWSYGSFLNGQTLTNALNIEMDIPISTYNNPRQGSFLRIWGVSLGELSQAANLNASTFGPGMGITISAGMARGLPLANPAQAGVIVQGSIFQAFGNWEGTSQTLDMELLPPMGTDAAPSNIVINWKAGTPLSQAIAATLKSAFPTYTVNVAISPNLVLSHNQTGAYPTLSDFASYIYELSLSIIGGTYIGVSIAVYGTMIQVYDGTQPYGATSITNPKQINFQDLIGQPTWISPTTINFKTVMRADIHIGDYVKMPANVVAPYVLTAPGAAFPNAPSRNKSIFQGAFLVQEMHHFGNYRQPTAEAWVTTFDAVAITQS